MPSYVRMRAALSKLRQALKRHARATWDEVDATVGDDEKPEADEHDIDEKCDATRVEHAASPTKVPLHKRVKQLLRRRTTLPPAVMLGDKDVTDGRVLANAMCEHLTRPLTVDGAPTTAPPATHDRAARTLPRRERDLDDRRSTDRVYDRRNDLLVDEMTSTIARDEVNIAVARLKGGTAPGIDGVHPWMVKSSGDAMTSSLLLLMRQSWKHDRLPTIWAAADVRLIPKKTMPTNFGGLRPISLIRQSRS